MTGRLGRPAVDRSEALGWLAVAGLVVYILVAVYDWRLPSKDGTSFGPVWAGLSAVVVLGLRVPRGRWEPVDALAACTAVAALLTDLVQFDGQLLRDLGIYLRAGEHFASGVPVYLTTVLTEAPIDKTTYPFLYPPPTLPFAAVLAALPRGLVEAGWLAGSVGVALAGLRLVGLSWRWALAALLWPPFFQGLYVGNVAVPVFALFVAAPWFGAGSRPGGRVQAVQRAGRAVARPRGPGPVDRRRRGDPRRPGGRDPAARRPRRLAGLDRGPPAVRDLPVRPAGPRRARSRRLPAERGCRPSPGWPRSVGPGSGAGWTAWPGSASRLSSPRPRCSATAGWSPCRPS